MVRLKRPVWVVVAFGCNVGDCKGQIEKALKEVSGRVKILLLSDVMVSEPYGVENQPPFLNGVFFGYTFLRPFELLSFLKEVEKKVGRKPRCRWCEREIDLDIIYYGNLELRFEELKVPHPDRLNRDFVLKPLAEIVPTLIDPLVGRSVKQLWEGLKRRTERGKRP